MLPTLHGIQVWVEKRHQRTNGQGKGRRKWTEWRKARVHSIKHDRPGGNTLLWWIDAEPGEVLLIPASYSSLLNTWQAFRIIYRDVAKHRQSEVAPYVYIDGPDLWNMGATIKPTYQRPSGQSQYIMNGLYDGKGVKPTFAFGQVITTGRATSSFWKTCQPS